MLYCESVSIHQAQAITGLPSELIANLVENNRIPGELANDGELYVGKHALLSWCRLYARILKYVTEQNGAPAGGYTAFELVWMSRNGMLGEEHVRA